MKTTITTFLLLFLCIGTNLQAQKNSDFSWAIEINPHIIYQLSSDSLLESSPKVSAGIAGKVFYTFFDRLHLTSGLQVNYWRLSSRDYRIVFPSDINPNVGIDYRLSWVNRAYDQFSLDIPLELRVDIFGKKNRFYLIGGIGFNYILEASGKSTIVESQSNYMLESELFDGPAEGFLLSSKLGIGFEFSLKNDHFLYFQPDFRWIYLGEEGTKSTENPAGKYLTPGLSIGYRF
ncbi:MAG: hypothetical protein GYB31_04430 [Bacteroidetes bacterium]|nr:hypothetical protein [Bacteroidota bacterium]